jgi:hypothetical protein
MNAGLEAGGQEALAKRIKPKEEWPVIASETKSQRDILIGYVLPLAAIGPIASFIGDQLFGRGVIFIHVRPSLMSGLADAIVSYLLFIAGIFLLSFIADWLAPKFGGTSGRLNAFKLVAYGATAAYLAGIFGLIPALGVFGLLGLYSLYLFYTGAGPMMNVPQDQLIGYIAITALCGILLNFLVGIVAAPILALAGFGGAGLGGAMDSDDEVTISIPGVGKIESGEVEKMERQVEAAVSGEIKPLGLDELKELMPARLGSYERKAIQTTRLGRMGSSGEGTYRSGDRQFRLTITDMGAVGAIAGIASQFGVEQDREDENGYERTGTVEGQMQTEQWNHASNRGKFGKVVANRFMIEADGNAESIDELKAAVNAIDEGDLKELVE